MPGITLDSVEYRHGDRPHSSAHIDDCIPGIVIVANETVSTNVNFLVTRASIRLIKFLGC